ncbi:sacsin N-terminal ATP-binding-like domain-containing protein [Roseateles sp. MS654]|uniref:sacsin N-terminal ATP-binding-like domain-containing protein n=1 Tax=Roseateles sp. MS654 TaxID=3412685 RepID=UPI003C2EDD66
MDSEAPHPQRDFIERIQRAFLVGDQVPEHLREDVRHLQTQFNNALKLLSEDLYSKKSHFVLELVQNADDNDYAKGVTPELTLDVKPDRLVLSNNEVGFNEDNISAICKVGASSKAKDKQHHIGEKGIGFKSVFLVSDAPEIHSNGYHFRFDRTDPDNLLGYVIPTWCEVAAEARAGTTTIVLPASPKYRFDSSTLDDLDARVLLFLNKLRQLTLIQEGGRCSYHRKDHNGVSHLETTVTAPDGTVSEGHLRYVRVTKTFDMTGNFADEKRPDVKTSSVVLAFPIEASGEARLEPSSYVFAYLPIHQMGFKFPLHADFILNSGREGVLNDRPWNQGLRDCIATTFVAAVDQFQKTEALGLSYLNYIPAASEVSDAFFGAVRKQIVEGLSAIASLPSASGDWRLPSQLRTASSGFRALFPSALARQLFDFDYVDDRVQCGTDLLRELGVDGIRHNLLLDLFKSKQEWLAAQPLTWRAQLYAYIAGNASGLVKSGLLTTPCLPTAEGKYVVPDEARVFFPLSGDKKYGFERELTIVDDQLYTAALELSPNVKELFETLKVRPDDPYDMVVSHILPMHADDSWKASTFDALVGHLRYVKDKLEAYLAGAETKGQWRTAAFQKLQEGLWVGSKFVSETTGWRFRHAARLYLGKEYKPEFCIETLLGGEPGAETYVSPDYLAKKPKDAEEEAASWREFFRALGVRMSPALEPVGQDWKCSNELTLLLGADVASTRTQTLECLSRNWSAYSSKLAYLTNNNRNRVETTFLRQLRATQAPLAGRRTSAPLPEAYSKTVELKEILGDDLPYIDAYLTEEMLEACGVTFRLNVRALIKRLGQLKQQNAGTLNQIRAIYRALEKRWDSDAKFIQESFEDDGLVQLKGTHKGWYSPSQVAWRSGGTFIDSLYPPLEGQFKDFQVFFQDRLGIPRDLPLAKWVDALTRLDSIADRAEREAEALAIYKRAEKALRPKFGKPAPRQAWVDVFREQAVFVDNHGALVRASGNLLANDAPDIADLFVKEEELSFLAVPSEDVLRLSELLGVSNVQLLSTVVEFEVEGSTEGTVDTLFTGRIQRLVPYIARVLYAKQPAALEEAVEAHRIASLWHIEVVQVAELTQSVTLGDFQTTAKADSAMQDGNILYRTKGSTLKDRIAAELSKYLVASTELADTIVRLLVEESEEDIEEVLRVKGIRALPPDLAAAVMQRDLPDEEAADKHPDHAEQPEVPAEDGQGSDEIEGDEHATEEVEAGAGAAPPADIPSPPPPAAQPPAPHASPTPASQQPAPPAAASPTATEAPPAPRPPALSSNPAPGATPSNQPPPSTPAGGPVWRRRPGVPPAAPSPAAPPAPASASPGSPPANAPFGWRRPSTPLPPAAPGQPPPSPAPHFTGGARRPDSSRPPLGRKARRGRSGRLLSYAEGPPDPNRLPPDGGQEQAEARDAVGKAAVAYAMATLAKRWTSLTEMPHYNPGYDLLARNAAGEEDFIEVKGQGGAWTQEGVALTPTELLMAQKKGEHYWLCVVEFAQDEKRRQLSLVKNPFGQVQQFRFDVGWKAAAEKISGAPSLPDKGLYVDIAGVGLGRILSVRGKGKFHNIHVILQDGKQANVIFNPAKMTLSEEPLWQE